MTQPDFEEWATEIHEWLSLLALESPRILSKDRIDSFLSRYAVHDGDPTVELDIVKIEWRGLIPANRIRNLFVEL